ncbi:MAG: 30S ribosomal protein S6, partial [Candidatus Cloacimonetes bacterium]|nr:30S ribosomal protein S6 [Candidatus Cloacimonadota bacterium]
MIVIAPSLKDEDAKKENEKVHSFIKKKGGKLLNSEEWGKK